MTEALVFVLIMAELVQALINHRQGRFDAITLKRLANLEERVSKIEVER